MPRSRRMPVDRHRQPVVAAAEHRRRGGRARRKPSSACARAPRVLRPAVAVRVDDSAGIVGDSGRLQRLRDTPRARRPRATSRSGSVRKPIRRCPCRDQRRGQRALAVLVVGQDAGRPRVVEGVDQHSWARLAEPAGRSTACGDRRRRTCLRRDAREASGRAPVPGRRRRRCRRSAASCPSAASTRWMPWTICRFRQAAGAARRLGAADGAGHQPDQPRPLRPHGPGRGRWDIGRARRSPPRRPRASGRSPARRRSSPSKRSSPTRRPARDVVDRRQTVSPRRFSGL